MITPESATYNHCDEAEANGVSIAFVDGQFTVKIGMATDPETRDIGFAMLAFVDICHHRDSLAFQGLATVGMAMAGVAVGMADEDSKTDKH